MAPATPVLHGGEHYKTPAARWRALTTRDGQATDAFVYAVRTTRIYCRPDCKARLARRANITFFDSAMQAESHGFRACKRCKPLKHVRPNTATDAAMGPSGPPSDSDDTDMKIVRAVRLIQHSALQRQPLTLSQLSKKIGLSKWHLQRVFKRVEGVTPRELAELIMRRDPSTGTAGIASMRKSHDDGKNIASDCLLQSEPSESSLSSPNEVYTPPLLAGDAMAQPLPLVFDNIDAAGDVETLLSELFPELYEQGKMSLGGPMLGARGSSLVWNDEDLDWGAFQQDL